MLIVVNSPLTVETRQANEPSCHVGSLIRECKFKRLTSWVTSCCMGQYTTRLLRRSGSSQRQVLVIASEAKQSHGEC